MRRIDANLYALIGFSLVFLTGCAMQAGDAITQPPVREGRSIGPELSLSAPERVARLLTGQVDRRGVTSDRGRSWVFPGQSGSLLYISEFSSGRVAVLSYPSGTEVGSLKGLLAPSGICGDVAGHLWVTDTLNQRIVEYRIGQPKRIAILQDPDEYPVDCSIDPTSGDLAVTNLYGSASPSLAAGSVVIYKKARGRPQGPYYDSVMYYMYFCNYDPSGDLFFDGESYGGQFRLAELPHDNGNIIDISLDQNIEQPGDIQFDGSDLLLGDQQAHVVYDVSVSGSQANVLSSTPLQQVSEIEQFAFTGSSIVAATGTGNRVSTWDFPNGGQPTATIKKMATPLGLALLNTSRTLRATRKMAALHYRPPSTPLATRRSWMDPKAKASDLLYIADSYNSVVDVYSYPQGRQMGTLSGFNLPQGECSDGQGDVFITNTNTAQIIEYAHGSSEPIAVLDDPNENPVGCAVDPKTGTLAVTNLTANGYGGSGSVAEYKDARGIPTLYFDPDIYFMFFCGYDDKGNLFVDGQHFGGGGRGFQLAELTPRSQTFRNIAMPVVVDFPGAVQWDGSDVGVGDQEADVIYRVHITGITASIDGTTPLSGGLDVVQFWRQGKTVIGPDNLAGDAAFWKYPQGGAPVKTITGLAGPEGATVSVRGQNRAIGPATKALPSIVTSSEISNNGGTKLAVPSKGAKCSGPLSFISDYTNGLVDVYSRTILCQVIYGFSNPNGIGIDARGDLYVTEGGRADIAILKPPYKTVDGTLSDPGQDPAGIAFCSGYIAVTNLETSQGGAGSVSIYTNGALQPSYTLVDSAAVREYAPACDANGNLYTSYLNAAGAGSVNEWLGATGNPVELTSISTGFPGGLRYQGGQLWVGDQRTPTITLWKPPFAQSLRTIYLQGSDDPVDFVVLSSARRITVADALLNEGIVFTLKGQERETLPGNGGGLAVGVAYLR